MRRTVFCLAAAILSVVVSPAQSTVTSQTARQALLEMFFSKTPGTLVKHLPIAMRDALEKSGATTALQQYSLLAANLQTQGGNVQTFDTGSVLLAGADPKTGEKFEIAVEKDALHGDQDDIELTFHVYKNGQQQATPFMPQMTFSMKQEAQIWKLNEISVTIHLPLADPAFLKALTEKMTPAAPLVTSTQTAAVSNAAFVPHSETPVQTGGSDATVIAAMRTILAAEATYAQTYPTVGYTCALSTLDGFGGGEPNERQAMLINSGLASGKKYGFIFALSECNATPATGFRLTAAPNANTFGRKAFCADQSGAIRSAEDGNPASCLASGTPIQ
jgi:hypothetical protein